MAGPRGILRVLLNMSRVAWRLEFKVEGLGIALQGNGLHCCASRGSITALPRRGSGTPPYAQLPSCQTPLAVVDLKQPKFEPQKA